MEGEAEETLLAGTAGDGIGEIEKGGGVDGAIRLDDADEAADLDDKDAAASSGGKATLTGMSKPLAT
ncbi:MAG: hypothetical protein M5U33_04585 [Pseudorhodoplanes sp.]|nr:hypothetical protein [Pseudorhodoplanes sp.]